MQAVVLCTPSEQHGAQTAACLAAGKHVLVEIPLAMSYVEGRGLAESARRKGLTLMVAHTHRYQGAMRRAQELIATGRLTLHSVVARYMFLRRENVGASGYVRSWTDNLLWHHGQHATDTVLWFLGVDQPGQTEVSAMLAPPDPHLGIPLDLSLLLRTAHGDQPRTGAPGDGGHVLQQPRQPLRLRPDRGGGHPGHRAGGAAQPRGGAVRPQERTGPEGRDSGLLQDREFFAAIREGRPPAISAESVLPALEVLQQAQDAYDRRQAQA